MSQDKIISEKYRGRCVFVFGAAGVSGQAITRLLHRLGSKLILFDEAPDKKWHLEIQKQINNQVILDLSDKDPKDIFENNQIDFIVTSPGIPHTHKIFSLAIALNVSVFGEIEIAYEVMQDFFEESMQPVPALVAITGTDGKSTTTALLCGMIEASTGWHCVPTGNFGFPFSLFVLALIGVPESRLEPSEKEIFHNIDIAGRKILPIVENSSFQLELIHKYKPDIAVFLNLAEDHMDRYDSLLNYLMAKKNIVKNQNSKDLFIAPGYITALMKEHHFKIKARIKKLPTKEDLTANDRIIYERTDLLARQDFKLTGIHNRLNLEAALICLEELNERYQLNVNKKDLTDFLKTFEGLPHRLQFVAKKNNIEFINDSKATTVHAVKTAIMAFADKKIYLLLGGRAKKTDFTALAGLETTHPISFYIYGESKNELTNALNVSEKFENLPAAFEAAYEDAKTQKPGSVLLLSPGCSSYDAYQNYIQRGDHFIQLVKNIL